MQAFSGKNFHFNANTAIFISNNAEIADLYNNNARKRCHKLTFLLPFLTLSFYLLETKLWHCNRKTIS